MKGSFNSWGRNICVNEIQEQHQLLKGDILQQNSTLASPGRTISWRGIHTNDRRKRAEQVQQKYQIIQQKSYFSLLYHLVCEVMSILTKLCVLHHVHSLDFLMLKKGGFWKATNLLLAIQVARETRRKRVLGSRMNLSHNSLYTAKVCFQKRTSRLIFQGSLSIFPYFFWGSTQNLLFHPNWKAKKTKTVAEAPGGSPRHTCAPPLHPTRQPELVEVWLFATSVASSCCRSSHVKKTYECRKIQLKHDLSLLFSDLIVKTEASYFVSSSSQFLAKPQTTS